MKLFSTKLVQSMYVHCTYYTAVLVCIAYLTLIIHVRVLVAIWVRHGYKVPLETSDGRRMFPWFAEFVGKFLKEEKMSNVYQS